MEKYIIKILTYWDEVKLGVGILLGILIQFLFTENKSWVVLMTISVSSIFVALYIVNPFIIVPLGVEKGSELATSLIAVSSLISMPLISVALSFLPKALKASIKQKLGVKIDND